MLYNARNYIFFKESTIQLRTHTKNLKGTCLFRETLVVAAKSLVVSLLKLKHHSFSGFISNSKHT